MRISLFALVLLLSACSGSPEPPPKMNYSLDWILGQWQRSNNAENQKTYETWMKDANYNFVGHGVTLQGSDTVFQERMEIVKKDGTLNFKVIVTGEEEPTYFKFTKQSSTSFTCENPANEFPKQIEYKRNGANLKARISAGEQVVDFLFVPMKQ